jgi:pyridoxine 5-phosphate synthase
MCARLAGAAQPGAVDRNAARGRPGRRSLTVDEVRPDQCTLVPVVPGEVTSQAGWQPGRDDAERLPEAIRRLHAAGVRVSLFVEASPEPIRWAASTGADRIELYTEPFARAFEQGQEAVARAFTVWGSRLLAWARRQ